MARIDTIDLGSQKITCLNITRTVGGNGENDLGDVMVIQALMKYIAGHDDLSMLMLGDWDSGQELEVTGDFDITTFNAIATFKSNWAHRLIRRDSLIHPANYEGRVLRRYKHGKLITITLLSQLADEVSMIIAGVPYMERIFHVFPELQSFVKDNDVYISPIVDDADLFQTGP